MAPVVARLTVPLPKERPVRSEAYRRAVASLPCALCGIEGYSNACHGDAGKGLSIKSGDLTCWPGCVDRPGVIGCHSRIGALAELAREERRAFERRLAISTQDEVLRRGLWPAGLAVPEVAS